MALNNKLTSLIPSAALWNSTAQLRVHILYNLISESFIIINAICVWDIIKQHMKYSRLKKRGLIQTLAHVRLQVVKTLYHSPVFGACALHMAIWSVHRVCNWKTSEWRASAPVASKTYNLPQSLETYSVLPPPSPNAFLSLSPISLSVSRSLSVFLLSLINHT